MSKPAQDAQPIDHSQSVIVRFDYAFPNHNQVLQLSHRLKKVLQDSPAGDFDGHKMAMDDSHGSVFMYGPDAGELFKVVKPTLEATDFLQGALAYLRFGKADEEAPEIDIEIGS